MNERCDEKYDCNDKSDERNCDKVVIDEKEYNKAVPPYIEGQIVMINVSIYLLNVNKLELPSLFDVKFRLELTWYDHRLEFEHLQNENILREDDKKKVWIPPLILSNTYDNRILIMDGKTTMSVLKHGQPVLSSQTQLHEATEYTGSENTVRYLLTKLNSKLF